VIPSTWLRVRDLFEQAIELESSAVSAWLERVEPRAEIRDEVKSLLGHHSRAGIFLSQPVADRVPELLDEDPPVAPGQTIGTYTIVKELGRGGMGRVFLATDQRLGRTVALKWVAPELARDAASQERLRREARAAAQLSHPGICTVFALEEHDGRLYMATEYVEGKTLRDEIASGVRPVAETILQTACDVAAALASAHERGVTHRDLKPENVMRTTSGRLKILDFGLARVRAGDEPTGTEFLTRAGAVVGTPAYMAPEQLNGQAADPRTDVFGFGLLVYELASGLHPFAAPTPLALAARVLEGSFTPLEQVRPDLPATLSAVVDRSLRKNPADRFASAAEIADVLARGHERPSSLGSARWWRMHQVVAIALYALASIVCWMVKEWRSGVPDGIFVAVGILATVGGVFRGHLLFTQTAHPEGLSAERGRAPLVTLVVDHSMAAALAVDGLLMTAARPLASVLILGLAVGIALARLLVEPSTTRAVFGDG
jgi:tRNA A-37 threonylcarbamoyl transferase component Bud32